MAKYTREEKVNRLGCVLNANMAEETIYQLLLVI